MKRTLLPLSLAMLLGASMQAQTTGVVAPNDWHSTDYPCDMNVMGYSGSETVYNSVALENATNGLETFTISKLVYSTRSGSAPSSGTGDLKLYYAVTTSEVTSPVPVRVMTEVFNGTVSADDFDGGNLSLTLTEPIVMHKGENLVVGFIMNVTESNIWNWAIGYQNSNLAKSWSYKGGPIDFTTTGGSNGDYPALSIVYTEGEGGETPIENAFEIDITSATATRLSATEGEISASYEVTKEENVEGYHFFVVRAPREGETGDQVLGSYDVKAGVRGEVTIPLTLDEDGEFTTYVKCNAIYKDGTESQPYEYSKGAVYVPAWVANAFDVEITHAHAVRISATQAEVSVTYNVTKEENVEGYKFEVVDSEGSVLGEEAVKAGAKSETAITLTLPDNNAAVDTKVKMWAVYTDGTASDVTTYDVTVPEYISGATGVDIVTSENGEAVYYNLQGARVSNPENGLFIRVVNGKAAKVMVK